MRVAVVGAGIFGCTTAIKLHRAGHEVHLYEAHGAIMQGASGHNQFRLHRGYHYPRSPETGHACRKGLALFRLEYGECIEDTDRHIYAIPSEGSKTSPQEYEYFCKQNKLAYTEALRPPVSDKIALAIAVNEPRYRDDVLRRIVLKRLEGVNLHLAERPKGSVLRRDFDQIVVAAYGNTNRVLGDLNLMPMNLRYEVVEKPVIQMPKEYPVDTGVVVMDGPFGCIDPYGLKGSRVFLMGHVVHAIHAANETAFPDIPKYLRGALNRGIVTDFVGTRFREMRDDLAQYIPLVAEARHMGSMFTVRAVLRNKDATDERPTLVDRLDDQVIRIFSGKVPTCVEAADTVAVMLREQEAVAA